MRLILKILKWFAIASAGLVIILFTLSVILQDNVVAIFLKSINRNISTKVTAESYKLSLLKRFPKAAVELKNITVLSSPLFDKSQFQGINTDTLLFAESASLEFRMIDLIKGNYDIGSIIVKNGRLGLYSDSSGMVNYEIATDEEAGEDDEFVINLEKVIVSGIKSHYINIATRLYINGLISNGRIRSRISGDQIDFRCISDVIIRDLSLYSADFNTEANIHLDLDLQKTASGVMFKQGAIELEDFDFDITGLISADNTLNLKIAGKNIDLNKLKNYLPDNYTDQFGEFSPQGILKSEVTITGLISRKQNPNIEAEFSLEKGNVYYKRSGMKISDISFNGTFTNGPGNSAETSMFEINSFSARPGSSVWSGSFALKNLNKPYIDLIFSGTVIPSELLQFIKLPEIKESEGSFRLNIKLGGNIGRKDKYTLSDLTDLKPEANIQFNSFSISLLKNDISIDDADGTLMISRHLWADNLAFTFREHRFKINGEFRNFPDWLSGKPVMTGATADVAIGDLKPSVLFAGSSQDSLQEKRAVKLPAGMEMEINFRIDNFEFREFTAGDIRGTLTYRPGLINLNSLVINSMDGVISGNCLLANGPAGSFVSQGKFTIENVDVNKAFTSFRNFGQDFLVANNLSGSLSGTLTLLMPLDSLFYPDAKATTAEGKYVIVNGVLKDFEPVKELSGFIELSELEEIKFSRLEDDLFIKNNYLAVPQMDIKSSAADFTVNGKHDFDNNYEYHVKAYLSEILSKKARKERNPVTEFGAIEEDGLGRTSIYLKITGNDEDLKVAYDFKAAGNNIKQSLRNEKGTLRTILNEEYGMFKGDTTIKSEPAPRPRFRIEFPETDTVNMVRDTVSADKDSFINRIFKKKKGITP